MFGNQTVSTKIETLHGRFYENALKCPDHIALISDNELVSYSKLRSYALSTANYLSQRGVKKGDRVAVILPRGIGQIAALLGILAIGAVYVPVAIKQPFARREKIIKSVEPVIILQNTDFLDDKPWDGEIQVDPESSAYIIYTSGSSGEPKGVEMSHTAAMNTIEEILHMWNIDATDSILSVSSFDFDLSVFDIFGLLTAGGTVVLIDEKDYRNPDVWNKLIETYEITIWNSAPALLDMFLTLVKKENHFPKLRLALVSGDWIPLYLPDAWHDLTASNSQFVALGGATEGGIWSNYYCVAKVNASWNSIPYGKALPGQKYRIVDERIKECGSGIPGELLIGGKSLAKGYINDSEMTMRKFIVDSEGNRWYRTGDRGMYWENGTIEFLGRLDTQVKIRGHRIELGEIESTIKEVRGIDKSVVVIRGDKYHKELIAFYSGTDVIESDIAIYLKSHLPEYCVPNSIIKLDSFPLSGNGKVDRKKLDEFAGIYSRDKNIEKSSDIVLRLWEEILGHSVPDLDENLFNIGADSLHAARFVDTLSMHYGIKVHMKEIFEKPTINELIEWVGNHKKMDIEFAEEGEI